MMKRRFVAWRGDAEKHRSRFFGPPAQRRGSSAAATFALAVFSCGAVSAQSVVNIPGPPIVTAIDANGVDLIGGSFNISLGKLSIGGAGSGLSRSQGAAGTDDFYGAIVRLPNPNPQVINPADQYMYSFTVTLGQRAETFSKVSGVFTPWRRNGSILSCNSTHCSYTLSDGTVANFLVRGDITSPYFGNTDVAVAHLISITKPDGEFIELTYPNKQYPDYAYSLTVSSSLGWMFKHQPSRIDAINTSVDYCSPTAESCANTTVTWPYIESQSAGGSAYDYNHGSYVYLLVDAKGNKARVETIRSYSPCPCNVGGPNYSPFYPLPLVVSVASPSGVTRTISYDQDYQYIYTGDDGRMPEGGDYHWVSAVKIGSKIWDYNFDKGNSTGPQTYYRTNTVKDPLEKVQTVYVESQASQILSDTNQLSKKTTYTYYGDKVKRVIPPEATLGSDGKPNGGYTQYEYDARGNVTEVRQVAKAGSGLADIVTTASYDATCANPKTCNKPNWVKDARLGQTDFTYAPEHGGLLTVTGPAGANNVRPQTRNTYEQFTPKIKDASGALVNSTPVWRLRRTETCASSTNSCASTADESVTLYEYNHNNLLLTAKTAKAGDASVSLTTAYGYDAFGNTVWVDGPRTDVDDRIYTTYDALRRPVFEIGADPDGAGPRARLVIKHNYDADSREYLTQRGVGAATDGSDFDVKSFTRRSYDPENGLLIKTEEGQP
jgi:hypothetical protein